MARRGRPPKNKSVEETSVETVEEVSTSEAEVTEETGKETPVEAPAKKDVDIDFQDWWETVGLNLVYTEHSNMTIIRKFCLDMNIKTPNFRIEGSGLEGLKNHLRSLL